LVEVVVALTVTGVVTLLVYGAANVALDAQTRMEQRRLEMRAEVAWHALVGDALRNARPGASSTPPVFVLEPDHDALGRPRDRLRFVTAGGTAPLTSDSDWEVTLSSTGTGVTMTAAPLGVSAPVPQVVRMPGTTGLHIRVLSASREGEWLDAWRSPGTMPRGIELTYWTEQGPAGAPVYISLPLGGQP
jgi:hypothetical protein